jgi:lipopolysaccharide export system permease protein
MTDRQGVLQRQPNLYFAVPRLTRKIRLRRVETRERKEFRLRQAVGEAEKRSRNSKYSTAHGEGTDEGERLGLQETGDNDKRPIVRLHQIEAINKFTGLQCLIFFLSAHLGSPYPQGRTRHTGIISVFVFILLYLGKTGYRMARQGDWANGSAKVGTAILRAGDFCDLQSL